MANFKFKIILKTAKTKLSKVNKAVSKSSSNTMLLLWFNVSDGDIFPILENETYELD